MLAQGWTALHRAAMHGSIQLCQVLVQDCGALLEVLDAEGNTPLHTAMFWGQFGTAAYLLSRGANPGAINNVSAGGVRASTPTHVT
jgi:ankyrin repeat protein